MNIHFLTICLLLLLQQSYSCEILTTNLKAQNPNESNRSKVFFENLKRIGLTKHSQSVHSSMDIHDSFLHDFEMEFIGRDLEIWGDKGREIYDLLHKPGLSRNDIERWISKYSDLKSVWLDEIPKSELIGSGFIRTKKYMEYYSKGEIPIGDDHDLTVHLLLSTDKNINILTQNIAGKFIKYEDALEVIRQELKRLKKEIDINKVKNKEKALMQKKEFDHLESESTNIWERKNFYENQLWHGLQELRFFTDGKKLLNISGGYFTVLIKHMILFPESRNRFPLRFIKRVRTDPDSEYGAIDFFLKNTQNKKLLNQWISKNFKDLNIFNHKTFYKEIDSLEIAWFEEVQVSLKDTKVPFMKRYENFRSSFFKFYNQNELFKRLLDKKTYEELIALYIQFE